ncbi:PorV/PorQ family protein [Gracilimonas mengyeensis]|uniref:Type IX secretion system protein PorV domain-containing protein n=1 Tax=Gracilimonas mengyeensis TaxID=1302730 RepID=A0A521EXQ0_9BACT|nr:PorV/PorQ family protein [Gracilimonas mengyeensis]SMO88666.1 hypothetical protein SAMN06265219_11423 [Gracilimonas mengyeensis]
MKKSLRSCLLFVFIVLLAAGEAMAQSKVGTTAAPFLTLGTGSRASALGHAYTASARGVDALFWNASGIAIPHEGKRGGVFLTNYKMFADIEYNALGITLPITEKGVIGISGAMLDYGTMEVTTELNPNGNGELFDAADMVFGISYAQPLTSNFFIGGQAKYITQRIWDMNANTVAVDIGLTLITDYINGLTLAASIQNFGGQMQMDGINVRDTYDPDENYEGNNERVFVRRETQEWKLPLSFKFGVMVPVIKDEYYELRLMGESHQTNDQYLNGDFGSEFVFSTNSTNFYVRVGYKDLFIDDVDNHLSYGAGLDMALSSLRVGFDFAIAQQNYLENVRMIDFRIYF